MKENEEKTKSIIIINMTRSNFKKEYNLSTRLALIVLSNIWPFNAIISLDLEEN